MPGFAHSLKTDEFKILSSQRLPQRKTLFRFEFHGQQTPMWMWDTGVGGHVGGFGGGGEMDHTAVT